jgi:hypothetical protein
VNIVVVNAQAQFAATSLVASIILPMPRNGRSKFIANGQVVRFVSMGEYLRRVDQKQSELRKVVLVVRL